MQVEDISILKHLKAGDFFETYLASKKGIPDKYAVRLFSKEYLSQNTSFKKYFDEQIKILKDVNHPNIIKFIELKESEKYYYLVREYCNGEDLDKYYKLYSKMNDNKTFTEEIVQHIMKQLVEAMKYLHNKKIIHRNLKIDNILIKYEDEKNMSSLLKAKFILDDFLFARYLEKGQLASTVIGSPLYMPPIMLNKLAGQEDNNFLQYDSREDIWSLGCICYELLLGENPFDAEDLNDLNEKVNKGDYCVPITLSKETISFINCMLQFDRMKRFNINKLCNHAFLKKNVNEFNKVNLNELKNIKIVDNSQILMNTKDNDPIWDYFGEGIIE